LQGASRQQNVEYRQLKLEEKVTYQFNQVVTSGENSEFRHKYVTNWLESSCQSGKILDVGAGPMPYRSTIQKTKSKYFSHDFEQYVANIDDPGLQSSEWPVYGHDFVCDIEDLNESAQDFDLVLCTEVLEHVPNPIKALEAISKTLTPGGKMLITMPFASRMHQAPYWFSSGLSRFWFETHAPKFSCKIERIVIAGDFVDQVDSELRQLLNPIRFLGLPVGHFLLRVNQYLFRSTRKQIPRELLQSGGLGIYVELVKTE
jgi:ubiquinone/menaquinone biosynthesis C-methylase UbiE